MPHFKTETFAHVNSAGTRMQVKVKVNVNAAGLFYCEVPEELRTIRTWKLEYKAYGDLRDEIKRMLKAVMEVEVKEEIIIRYNIESHVSFATDEHGNIFPNASFPGASWKKDNSSMYGSHSANTACMDGYSLTVGAECYIKETHSYGEKKTVKYKLWHGDDSHGDSMHPARLLNSWACVNLRETRSKEIPYSDEAALFFHNFMHGMAELSRKIQEATFDQDKLQSLIASGSQFLLTKQEGK